MKFLTFLALPVLINSLTEFAHKDELIHCIHTCQKFVTPCIRDKTCLKDYSKCIDHNDAFTCFSSSNNLMMSKITQCMDQTCVKLEKSKEQKQVEDEIQEMQQFQKKPLPKYTPQTSQTLKNEKLKENKQKRPQNSQQVQQVPIISAHSPYPQKEEEQQPKLILGRVIQFNVNGQIINDNIPQNPTHPNGKQKIWTEQDEIAAQKKRKQEQAKRQNKQKATKIPIVEKKPQKVQKKKPQKVQKKKPQKVQKKNQSAKQQEEIKQKQ